MFEVDRPSYTVNVFVTHGVVSLKLFVSNPWRIHGTGRLAYKFTIKINHSCIGKYTIFPWILWERATWATVNPPGCFNLFQDHIGLVYWYQELYLFWYEICRFLSNGTDGKFPHKRVFGFSWISFWFKITSCTLSSFYRHILSYLSRFGEYSWSVPNILSKPMFLWNFKIKWIHSLKLT